MSREYCNPLDLEYKYQHYSGNAHREAADPTAVLFKGKYYIFSSMSAGFYYSDDMVCWKWHENRDLDMYRYAPDVRQIGEYLYFCASTRNTPSTIWRTKDPLSDEFEKVWEDTKEQYLRSKEMREIGTRFNKFSQRLIKAGKKA